MSDTRYIIIQGPNGTRKVPANKRFTLASGEMVTGSGNDEQIGLGDVVAKVTKMFGFTPCAPCNERRRKLNKVKIPKVF